MCDPYDLGFGSGHEFMMYLEEAWRALVANRVQSALTMLGLIIGVGAVIAIQDAGTGMADAVNGLLGKVSDRSFFIFANSRQADLQNAAVSIRDLTIIQNTFPGIIQALPSGRTTELVRSGHVVARFSLSADGVIPVENLPTVYGRHFSQDDVDQARNVVVISDQAYARLFPAGGDPVGASIYAGAGRYEIIGVLAPPKRGFLKATFSGEITFPWTTYVNRVIHGGTFDGAAFVAENATQIPSLEKHVEDELRKLHGYPKGVEYESFDKANFTKGVNGVFIAMTLGVGLIGAVSLLVAGIGIMNIMLVSVAERTREIGLRKAIGARGGQILLQFFLEALMLCTIGSGLGLAIGLSIGAAINDLLIVKFSGSVPPVPLLPSLFVAGGFAIVATLAFGTYPAYRAARLNPIEALRYE